MFRLKYKSTDPTDFYLLIQLESKIDVQGNDKVEEMYMDVKLN
jgi:hypothetical protein